MSSELTERIPQDPELLDALALEVLQTTRDTLMVSYRFLDRALWKMPFVPRPGIVKLGTDGKELFYNAQQLLAAYAESPSEVARDFLHIILHCVFYHPFIGGETVPLSWNLASDITAEAACVELAGERFPSEHDAKRLEVISNLQESLGNLSAEKMYRHINKQGIKPGDAQYLTMLFERDDHGAWYHDPDPTEDPDENENVGETQPNEETELSDEGRETEYDEPEERPDQRDAGGQEGGDEHQGENAQDDDAPNGGEGDDGEDDSDEPEDQMPEDVPQSADGSEADQQGSQDHIGPEEDGPNEEGKQEWEGISKQIRVDLETRSRNFGTAAGNLMQQLAMVNRRRYDYRDFLRRFSELGEEMAVNDDEFDLVFYDYGLRVYGNMPLIEPLEYREVSKVREFVVAIDTSGSVEGPLVKSFVEETYSILKSSETFFTKTNIHIIQCDAHIQSDITIHSDEEFKKYIDKFQVKGFGGTDFRPVFARVDSLIESGELQNLKGLVYFTDGYGTFPQIKPEYETVFVFVNEDLYAPQVPAWALKLVIDSQDLEH